jgi:ABC-2 type transport system ATP-binding protein
VLFGSVILQRQTLSRLSAPHLFRAVNHSRSGRSRVGRAYDGLDPNQKHEVRQLIRRMGEKKAIIFSTHILEEVDAACSRAIIIDRGRIVANGTPEELRRKSEWAGAVTLRVTGINASALNGKLMQIPAVKSYGFREKQPGSPPGLPESRVNGTLASNVPTPPRVGVSKLHREGRLDEVFRNITMPDTVKGGEE